MIRFFLGGFYREMFSLTVKTIRDNLSLVVKVFLICLWIKIY